MTRVRRSALRSFLSSSRWLCRSAPGPSRFASTASSRSTPTPALPRLTARWRPTPTATSSSSGRATHQDGSTPASSPAASRAPAFRWRSSSRSTPTPPSNQCTPVGGGGRRRRLRRRLAEPQPGRRARRRLRPAASRARAAPLASEFQVNTYTHGNQTLPVGGGGRRRRLRRRLGQPQPGRLGLRRFRPPLLERGRSAGQPSSRSTPTPTSDQQHSVGGGPTLTATSSSPGRAATRTADSFGVFARRFSSAGAPLAASSRSIPTPSTHQTSRRWRRRRRRLRRRLAELRPGRLAASASSPAASRAPALPWPASSRSTPTPPSYQPSLSVATDADGDFVVVWQSATRTAPSAASSAERFSSAGIAFGRRVPGQHLHPERPVLPRGRHRDRRRLRRRVGRATARTARSRASSPSASRRIALDIDGNGSTQPLTDGLLVLRFLFGFGGGVLIAGAVDAGCTRCDAAAIEAYLDRISRAPRRRRQPGEGSPHRWSVDPASSVRLSPARHSSPAQSARTARAATRLRSRPTSASSAVSRWTPTRRSSALAWAHPHRGGVR